MANSTASIERLQNLCENLDLKLVSVESDIRKLNYDLMSLMEHVKTVQNNVTVIRDQIDILKWIESADFMNCESLLHGEQPNQIQTSDLTDEGDKNRAS